MQRKLMNHKDHKDHKGTKKSDWILCALCAFVVRYFGALCRPFIEHGEQWLVS